MSPKPILCACVLTVILAGCGGADGSGQSSGQGSGGSPSAPQPSAQPQVSAAPQSSSGSAAPVAAADGQPDGNGGNAPATDTQTTDANGQTENYYGQAAPPAQNQDDPQAQWKEQRDAAPAG